MLLVLMVLMVGVTSAHGPSTTAPQSLTPRLENTQSDTESRKTPSTVIETVLKRALEKSPRLGASTLPFTNHLHFTYQAQPIPDNTDLTTTDSQTSITSRFRASPDTPVIGLLTTSAKATTELPLLESTRNSFIITTNENRQTTQGLVVATKHSSGSHLPPGYAISPGSIQRVRSHLLSRYENSGIETTRPTIIFSLPSEKATTEDIHSSSTSDQVDTDFTEKPFSPTEVNDQRSTTTTSTVPRSSKSSKIMNSSTLLSLFGEPKSRSHEPIDLQVNVTGENGSTRRKDGTRPLELRTLSSKTALSSSEFPVPTARFFKEDQNHNVLPSNTVESMFNLPWVKQKSTSELFELDNELHPTQPSVFSNRSAQALKRGRLWDMSRSSTIPTPSSVLKTSERNLHDKYRGSVASVQSLSSDLFKTRTTDLVLVLSANQSVPPATSFQAKSSAFGNNLTTTQVPPMNNKNPLTLLQMEGGPEGINKSLNESLLSLEAPRNQNSLPLRGASVNNYKPQTALQVPLKGVRRQPTSFPLRGAPPKYSKMTAQLPLKNTGNQSASFPLASALKLKPKLPGKVSPPPLKLTENSPPERLPTLTATDPAIDNATQSNCTNDYCVSDEEYIDMMLDYMFPTSYEWVLIGMHIIVFVGGLVGNALVCVAVYRNHSMRTVTNYFIVNLAVADFLVIFLCLPPTVLWDVTETWFMGTTLCKIVLYFQVRATNFLEGRRRNGEALPLQRF